MSSKPGGILKWSKYFILLFLAVCIGYVAHELAHFGMFKTLGYAPVINWRSGSVSAYDTAGEVIPRDILPPQDRILISLAGPFITLLLAAGFAILYTKRQDSFLLFAIAIMNAVYRFNIFIDGFNSDEGKIANVMSSSYGPLGRMAGLTIPLIVWTASIILTCILINKQTFFKRTYWAIPVWVLVDFTLVILLRVLTIALL
jgi:hypothetical protein